MKINIENDAPDIRIEIFPLIDVIFCILTFFILAALGFNRQQAIGLDLPKANTGTPQVREMLVVSIDPLGQTYVEKQPVIREQLRQVLVNYIKAKPEGTIVLNASQMVGYNDVVQVLDLLRSVGGNRVALATQPDSNSAPSQPNIRILPPPPTVPNSAAPLQPQVPSPQGQLPDSGLAPAPASPNLNVPLNSVQPPSQNNPSVPANAAE